MKLLVTYWSQTGNTKRVAEAIFSVLPAEKIIIPIEMVESLDEFALSFIGFPVMQFGPPQAARKFFGDHAHGRKIALFITHAMLSQNEDRYQQAMLEKELEKCRLVCSQSELAGFFHCQGELSEKLASDLLASNFPMLAEFAGMRPQTVGHPDPEELVQAGKFALDVLTALQGTPP